MIALVVLGLTAFLLCLVFTPLCRDAFVRAGLVDQPDEDRKFHKVAVPHSGGIGIFCAFVVSLGVTALLVPGALALFAQYRPLWVAILPATALVFIVGIRDDLRNLRPRQKLAGQIVASLLAVSLGARIDFHHGPAWLGFAFSVFWLLACTNAVNLIDGMDGLASGVGLTATVTVLAVALLSGNMGLAMAAAPLAGALLAFLRYNFAPASVFLGDGGSLTVGFLLGCFGLVWSQHSGLIGILGPSMALALPLLDVSLAILRRYLRRVPIFKGDRGHIHHRVQDLGLSVRAAALMLYAWCAVCGALGLLHSFAPKETAPIILGVFVVLVLVGVHRLRYIEISAARRMLSHRKLRQAVCEEIYVEEMRQALLAARNAEECWLAVHKFADHLHFSGASLRIGEDVFAHEVPLAVGEPAGCTIHIPLGVEDYLTLTGSATTAPQVITTVLPLLQLAMFEKFQSFQQARRPLSEAA